MSMRLCALLAAATLLSPVFPALAQGDPGRAERPPSLIDSVPEAGGSVPPPEGNGAALPLEPQAQMEMEPQVPSSLSLKPVASSEGPPPPQEAAPTAALDPATPGATAPGTAGAAGDPALPNPDISPADVIANSPPPVFYDTQDAVPAGASGSPTRKHRPLKSLSADKEPGSAVIVVKKDAPGQSPQAKLAAAQRAIALGRYDAALGMYDDLLARDKRDPEILMGRAVALHKLQRFDAAIDAYEQVLSARPQTVEAEVNMLGLMAQRYPAVAIQRLRALHQKHPERTDILAQMAVAHGNLGNLDDALKTLGMAAAAEPTNPLHLYNMAVIADRKGDKGQAVQYYEKALEADSIYGRGESLPRADIYARLAQIR